MVDSKQLARQLAFIETSCRSYDAGFCDEAVRIAVAIRVLIHESKNSHSLLHQLCLRDSVQLLSTFPDTTPSEGVIAVSFGGLLSGSGVEPALDRARHRSFLTVEQWWQQVVHIFNDEYSRRDVVLSAANQDGGAHVDPRPSEKTKGLRSGVGTLTTTTIDGETTTRDLDNSHFYLVRQFGYEILQSPALVSVAHSA